MAQYIARRLFVSIPALLGIVFVVFVLARWIPGDPCLSALGERATEEICDAFNERYGLNEPIPVQFVLYLGQLARGDLGDSIRQGRPVAEILIERLPVTIELAFYSLLFASIVGIALGLAAAIRRNSKTDVGTMLVANVGVSIPVFVLGLTLQFIFAVVLRGTFLGLPPSGRLSPGLRFQTIAEAFGLEDLGGIPGSILEFLSNIYTFNFLITFQWEPLLDAWRHLILPAIALGTISLAIIARITRSSLLEVLGLDYIRTARAKGLAERRVINHHALRNALLPVVTLIGLQLGFMLSGAVLTEIIFSLPGLGRLAITSVLARDFPMVQGVVLVAAAVFVASNVLVDVLYAYLDPRIRYG